MQSETQTTVQIIAIVATVAMLLGWLVRVIINYFIHKTNAKDKYIEDLVAQNQRNTENFVNTINHNQTKINDSIRRLADSIDTQSEVFKKFIR